MGDLDDIGFPVETAKPKIFQVRVNHVRARTRSHLSVLFRDTTGASKHSGADAVPAGQGGHMDDDDNREHPQGAQGDQRRVCQGRAA